MGETEPAARPLRQRMTLPGDLAARGQITTPPKTGEGFERGYFAGSAGLEKYLKKSLSGLSTMVEPPDPKACL
jgi:hypothetical protein